MGPVDGHSYGIGTIPDDKVLSVIRGISVTDYGIAHNCFSQDLRWRKKQDYGKYKGYCGDGSTDQPHV